MLRRRLVIAALLFVFLMATACQKQETDGQLNLLGSDPSTLDPALCQDAESASYIVEIFSGLVTLDRELRVLPDIAESWELSSDGRLYTFHLRRGVRFHDGKEVRASDFKYSIERAADPETGSPVADAYLGDIVGIREKLRGQAREVSGVRVIDDATLEIEIDAPKAYFLSKLTYPTAFVVDRDNVASGANWTSQPNGTGPFRLKEWVKGQRIVLERNPDYYRQPARLEQVNFIINGGRGITMYESGEIDVVAVGLADIDRALDPENPLHRELVTATNLSVQYVGFNTTIPPFDDAEVRRAFGYAVDKDKIIEVVLKGLVERADGILPPSLPGYSKDLVGLGYDPEMARRLIAESSYNDPSRLSPIVISAPGEGASADVVAVAVAAMWQQNLGVEVEIRLVDWSSYLEGLKGRRFQVFGVVSWVADYPDPENFLDLLFHSQSQENNTAYHNPRVDELLERARTERDAVARLQIYQEAEGLIVSEAPWLPLSFGKTYLLVKPYVEGYVPPPATVPMLKDVWIKGE